MQGVGGVYRGLGPTVMKQGSNQAIRFFVMESLRNKYTGGDRAVAVPYYLVALFGATAGEVLQTIFILLCLLPIAMLQVGRACWGTLPSM